MGYYDNLVAKWPNVAGADDAAKLAALNAETVTPGPWIDLPVGTFSGYLERTGLTEKLQAGATSVTGAAQAYSAKAVRLATGQTEISVLEMADDTKRAEILAMLDTLVSASVIDQSDADGVTALAQPSAPWWQENGYEEAINLGDLAAAGLIANVAWTYVVGAPTIEARTGRVLVPVSFRKNGAELFTRQFPTTGDADIDVYCRRQIRFFAQNEAVRAQITTGSRTP